MKKSIKALGMLALAATLSMGMTSVANATTGEYTITINNQEGFTDSIDGNTFFVFGGGFFVPISEEPVSFTSGVVQMEKLSYNNSNSTNA